MQKLAKVGRINKDGKVREAAVNTAHVRYIVSQDSGTYIAFDDEHDSDGDAVTPIGIKSPDPVEVVLKRLNRPYRMDVSLRVAAIVGSAIVVVLAIVFSQHCSPEAVCSCALSSTQPECSHFTSAGNTEPMP